MDWDTTKDYMNSFIGAVILFLGLIFIPEIRKRKKYWITILVLIVLLFLLGIDKINRDKRKDLSNQQSDNKYKGSVDSLNTKIEVLSDSLNSFLEFQHNLEKDKNITRDPSTNQPKIFVNYIDRVDKLDQH
ncbi:MAG: hypothetical protein JSS98_15070 [Bacteroidetes bacterium]|nr:hypothetical protein [Bacteroidota bacterium]